MFFFMVVLLNVFIFWKKLDKLDFDKNKWKNFNSFWFFLILVFVFINIVYEVMMLVLGYYIFLMFFVCKNEC